MSRLAAVDVGTNSVLLLVAERGADGVVRPVREEADITRLGRGVDRSGVLSSEGMQATLDALARFAALARQDGAQALVVTATSAARDARNGSEFLDRARARTGATVEILSGDEEARLSYLAVAQDFAAEAGEAGLLAIDVGGGSTELVHGRGRQVLFRRSLDIGSVRLTERCVRSDPPTSAEQEAIRERGPRRAGPPAPVPAGGPGGRRRRHRHQPLRDRARDRALRRRAGARRMAAGGGRGRVRSRLCALPLAERRVLPGCSRSAPTCCPPARSSSRPRSRTSAPAEPACRTAGSAGESFSIDGRRSDDLTEQPSGTCATTGFAVRSLAPVSRSVSSPSSTSSTTSTATWWPASSLGSRTRLTSTTRRQAGSSRRSSWCTCWSRRSVGTSATGIPRRWVLSPEHPHLELRHLGCGPRRHLRVPAPRAGGRRRRRGGLRDRLSRAHRRLLSPRASEPALCRCSTSRSRSGRRWGMRSEVGWPTPGAGRRRSSSAAFRVSSPRSWRCGCGTAPRSDRGGRGRLADHGALRRRDSRALRSNSFYWVSVAGLTLMTFSIGGLAVFMPAFLERSAAYRRAGRRSGSAPSPRSPDSVGTLVGGVLG